MRSSHSELIHSVTATGRPSLRRIRKSDSSIAWSSSTSAAARSWTASGARRPRTIRDTDTPLIGACQVAQYCRLSREAARAASAENPERHRRQPCEEIFDQFDGLTVRPLEIAQQQDQRSARRPVPCGSAESFEELRDALEQPTAIRPALDLVFRQRLGRKLA